MGRPSKLLGIGLCLILGVMATLLKLHHEGVQAVNSTIQRRRMARRQAGSHNATAYRTVACRLQRPFIGGEPPNVTQVVVPRVGIERCEQVVVFPRVYLFPDFLRRQEVLYLLNATRPLFRMHGGELCEELKLASDGIIGRVLKRIATLTRVPTNHAEEPVVMRCEPKQSTMLHRDARTRQATLVAFLEAPLAGGEISFPSGKPQNLTIAPRRGMGVLWYNVNELGRKVVASNYAFLAPRARGGGGGPPGLWVLIFRWRTTCQRECGANQSAAAS
eukprot:GGOE01020543.1.p1 GENE.GGOE01020543.1~~GGOE01020543.1.p1  ORF type:complete len:275 (+),score=52.67 GGOE01020543.1:82-906(+)